MSLTEGKHSACLDIIQIKRWNWTWGAPVGMLHIFLIVPILMPSKNKALFGVCFQENIELCFQPFWMQIMGKHLIASNVCSTFKNVVLHRCPLSVILSIWSTHSNNAMEVKYLGWDPDSALLSMVWIRIELKKTFSAILESDVRKNPVRAVYISPFLVSRSLLVGFWCFLPLSFHSV